MISLLRRIFLRPLAERAIWEDPDGLGYALVPATWGECPATPPEEWSA